MTDLTFDDREDYLLARYAGSADHTELVELVRRLLEESTRLERNRVLVDMTSSRGEVSVTERYRIATLMSERWDRAIRIALVVREDQILEDRFWVTVTRNHGLDTNVFRDEDEAIEWLTRI